MTPTGYLQPCGNMVTFYKDFGMTSPWFPHLYVKCDWNLGDRVRNCSAGHGFMQFSEDLVKMTSPVTVGNCSLMMKILCRKTKLPAILTETLTCAFARRVPPIASAWTPISSYSLSQTWYTIFGLSFISKSEFWYFYVRCVFLLTRFR